MAFINNKSNKIDTRMKYITQPFADDTEDYIAIDYNDNCYRLSNRIYFSLDEFEELINQLYM